MRLEVAATASMKASRIRGDHESISIPLKKEVTAPTISIVVAIAPTWEAESGGGWATMATNRTSGVPGGLAHQQRRGMRGMWGCGGSARRGRRSGDSAGMDVPAAGLTGLTGAYAHNG